jgi:putative ABC transport system ATP-binding protein
MSALAVQPAPSGAAVETTKLVKNFGTGDNIVRVLRGVDFEAPYGEMTFLVGPSGSGKTTLLSVVAGLLNPTGGEIRVLGEDIAHLRGSKSVLFRRQNLGFVFQQFNLLPALTAAENAAVPLLAAGWKRKQAVEKAMVLLKDLGLEARANATPNQLSGGQQQRVAFARALIHDPKLVVCDEPTSALDAETGHHVMELLRTIALRPDRAVLVVTHDNRIFNFADRIAFMDDGLISKVERSNGGAHS